MARSRHSCPRLFAYLLKSVTGIIASFPMGFTFIQGHICIIHDPQRNITYCLCLSFQYIHQGDFESYILSYLVELERPFSLLLALFDVIVEDLRVECNQSIMHITRTATALSTGYYMRPRIEEPFDVDLNKISRDLTAQGDRGAALKRVLKSTIQMMEALHDITTANRKANEPIKALELRTPEWFYGEDVLWYLIWVTKTLSDDLDEHAVKIQAHVQTVCRSSIYMDSH